MLHFNSDYMETAHPAILRRFAEIASEQFSGYGLDRCSASAAEKIAALCGKPDAVVKFLCGGTQTNAVVIDALLRGYEGVIAAESGHIATHEAGAIEGRGHKVLTLPENEGRLNAEQIRAYMESFLRDENRDHVVQPKMVYISNPTESGTIYKKAELAEIRRVCDAYGLYLYVDGARLGYGLTAAGNDVTLKDLASFCDVFYIGGTKVGAMCGEAVVIPDPALLPRFFTHIKRSGALLAKGWVLGAQFDTLFTDDLYFKIARHANEMAALLKEGFREKGFRFYIDSPTNQQFLIVSAAERERFDEITTYGYWCPYDEDHTVIRFAASWATREEDVKELLRLI